MAAVGGRPGLHEYEIYPRQAVGLPLVVCIVRILHHVHADAVVGAHRSSAREEPPPRKSNHICAESSGRRQRKSGASWSFVCIAMSSVISTHLMAMSPISDRKAPTASPDTDEPAWSAGKQLLPAPSPPAVVVFPSSQTQPVWPRHSSELAMAMHPAKHVVPGIPPFQRRRSPGKEAIGKIFPRLTRPT